MTGGVEAPGGSTSISRGGLPDDSERGGVVDGGSSACSVVGEPLRREELVAPPDTDPVAPPLRRAEVPPSRTLRESEPLALLPLLIPEASAGIPLVESPPVAMLPPKFALLDRRRDWLLDASSSAVGCDGEVEAGSGTSSRDAETINSSENGSRTKPARRDMTGTSEIRGSPMG
jgi:hypothetical protein